ncbi:ABC transporter permease [Desulfosporosinus sp.]|uniref:ABC transporter permease n=1 Tax=Desulfosporosinus sp. TaxID=157907 RepID=UPI000E9FE45B|nr:ABC transporter permease [Desulfosporosinus sp.]MBC2721240.1 ABC transporter permease [Desulfosporosinus sp.]MBC2728672.1 ABC transporter permease [Desulfosporosinus sp.]HBV88500.1 nitrate ABC transporter permease [Desulfosporosinus sp.]
MKKLQNITNKLYPTALLLFLLLVWHMVTETGFVPKFMLPSPIDVIRAFINSFSELMQHAAVSLTEAFGGLAISIVLAFSIALLMDRFEALYKAVHPLLVVTQTIPTVALAPLLVLWLGYDMAPKITLVVLTCFFPMTIALLGGFKSSDTDAMNLMRAMGARKWQIYRYIKLPNALPGFFSGLKISVSYSIVGAVIAEWLGGNSGLGVYMTRVRKSYAFDKMFAVIFLIIILSLLLMKCVGLLERRAMPWRHTEEERN